MKRLAAAVAVVAATALVPSFVAAAADQTGGAKLHQIEESGIRAAIGFLDTGTELFVFGEATGLDPGQAYISLVYDNGSVPSGPDACAPSDENDLSGAQMFAGLWQVDSFGNGTLTSVKTGPAYVSVEQIGAMSGRVAATAGSAPPPSRSMAARTRWTPPTRPSRPRSSTSWRSSPDSFPWALPGWGSQKA